MTAFLSSGCRSEEAARIKAGTDWQYSLLQTDSVDEVRESSFRSLEKLSDLHTLLPGKSGYVWLRFSFQVPASLWGEDLSLYGGRISMADTTYINGVAVGNCGVTPPGNEFSAWNETRCYHIPSPLLNQDSINELLIRVWTHGEGSVSDSIFIGTTADVKKAARVDQFLNSTLMMMFALCMVVIGLYSMVFFIMRPSEKEYLFFSILNIAAAAYLSVWYIQDLVVLDYLSISFLTFQKVMSGFMLFVLTSILIEFMNAYVHRRERWYFKIPRYILTVVPAVMIFSRKDYADLKALTDTLHLMMIPFILYMGFIVIRSIAVRREGAVSLTLGFLPFILSLAFDVIPHSVLGIGEFPVISTYSWMFVLMSFLMMLARRFSKARNEAEELNVNLEKKVSDRTRELSDSNDSLLELNIKLEKMNRRARQDMDLAVNVQRNFYPKSAPKVSDWDIAYVFNPVSGVSGDLYDFFHEGDTLKGCCLFDVSGHGISSGLVTILSKNIITREFEKGSGEKISRVMGNISEAIGQDKGEIENYLTGILLRINGNHVEYANGGHPAMLLRSAKSGKVVPALIKGKSSGGGLVGIAGMEPDFSGIHFEVKSGDSLLLYTDCLYESRNSEGTELGSEGVARLFAGISGGSAKDQLDELLKAFRNYTGEVSLADDLTIILLRKK